jgi:hypothetical protein
MGGLQVFHYPGTNHATIVSQSCPLFETKIEATETSHHCLLSSMGGHCVWQIDNVIKLSIFLWKTWCHLNSFQSTRTEYRSPLVLLLLRAHNRLDPVATPTCTLSAVQMILLVTNKSIIVGRSVLVVPFITQHQGGHDENVEREFQINRQTKFALTSFSQFKYMTKLAYWN